eukprot:TRINITY_DN1567_c0_g1_i1.p1 TRINITY_DN1567_c0_g1~~TRINITY_DN1567_c0_g1_i1.p1  ORF type:complete len:463 (+),score=72.85 TRINITY_DN1567_c0_g1_i1:152-1540(+)
MSSFLSTVLLVLLLVNCCLAKHAYLLTPQPRTNYSTGYTGCFVSLNQSESGAKNCSVCDGAYNSSISPPNKTRGSTITLAWPRRNNTGGFIRIAWAPATNSTSNVWFDQFTQYYFCYEQGRVAGEFCAPYNASDPNLYDYMSPSNGSCSYNISVPRHLWTNVTRWTLQWAWFGGSGDSGDHYSCKDYVISGTYNATDAVNWPKFIGGDYSNPNSSNLCKFFNTNKLGVCKTDPCNTTSLITGARSGFPIEADGTALGTYPPTKAPTVTPTDAPTPAPSHAPTGAPTNYTAEPTRDKTSTNSPTAKKNDDQNALSIGATAGISISLFFVGLAVGIGITCFCMKKNWKPKRSRQEPATQVPVHLKGVTTVYSMNSPASSVSDHPRKPTGAGPAGAYAEDEESPQYEPESDGSHARGASPTPMMKKRSVFDPKRYDELSPLERKLAEELAAEKAAAAAAAAGQEE